MVESSVSAEAAFRFYPNYKQEYQWLKSDEINKGGFGTVYKAKRIVDGKTSIVAVKKFHI